MTDRSKVKIPPLAAEALAADLDDAIRMRRVPEIRAFSREAELSGLDQPASRGREIADVIEAKSEVAGRAELTKIKAAFEPPAPTEADLVRRFDESQRLYSGSSSRPPRRGSPRTASVRRTRPRG